MLRVLTWRMGGISVSGFGTSLRRLGFAASCKSQLPSLFSNKKRYACGFQTRVRSRCAANA